MGHRALEVIDHSVSPRGALNPRHARGAQAARSVSKQPGMPAAFSSPSFAEAFGEHCRILDRHSRALRGERQHGMCGSPSSAIAPLVHSPPSGTANSAHRRQPSTAPIIIRTGRRSTRRGERALEFVGIGLAAPARPVPRPRHHRDDVDLAPARDRIDDEMPVRAHPELDPARGVFARQLRGFEPCRARRSVRRIAAASAETNDGAPRTRRRRHRSAPAPVPAGARGAALDHGQSLGMGGGVLELAAEPQLDIGMVVDLRPAAPPAGRRDAPPNRARRRETRRLRRAADEATSPPLCALIRLMASGVTARAASRGCNPSSIKTRLALGESCRPAPTSSSRSASRSVEIEMHPGKPSLAVAEHRAVL